MRLSLRQTQRVVMTPLLQQAIQLLQLSTLELEQVVRKELEENPLLEEVAQETQDVDADAPATAEAGAAETPTTPATPEPVSKETSSVDGERADELPFDLTAAVFDEPDERTPVSMEEREELPFENLGRTGTSLDEYLNEQLRLATDDPRAVAIGEAIIGNLDDDGYLRAEVDEIATGMGVSADEVEKVLRSSRDSIPRAWLHAACRSASSSSSRPIASPIPCPWRSSRSTSRTWSGAGIPTSRGRSSSRSTASWSPSRRSRASSPSP